MEESTPDGRDAPSLRRRLHMNVPPLVGRAFCGAGADKRLRQLARAKASDGSIALSSTAARFQTPRPLTLAPHNILAFANLRDSR